MSGPATAGPLASAAMPDTIPPAPSATTPATFPVPSGEAPASRAQARARHATRALFGGLGLMAGVWGAHVPSVKQHYGLDEGLLAIALLAAGVGAVIALFVAGRVIARLGTRHAAGLTGLVMVLALALVLQSRSLAWLLAVNLVFGMAMSVHDMAINAEGTALEALGGKPIMSGLHGMFSVGAMAGALLASAMLHRGWAAPLQFAGVAAALAVLTVLAWRCLLDAHPAADGAGLASFVWPRGQLMVIGLLIFAGMIAEGVMYDWSVLYLVQELQQPAAAATLGFAVVAGAMAAARLGVDAARARWGEGGLLAAGAALAAAAMALLLLAAQPVLAFAGFALVGIGLAPAVPILYTAAARIPGVPGASGIAAVSSIGYAAFIALPSVILILLYGQTRIFFVMSRDGLLPEFLSSVHPKWKTPHVVTAITGAAVAFAAAFLPVGQLADIANAGTLYAFMMVAIAVWILRKREPNRERAFVVPALPLVASLTVAGCVFLFVNLPLAAMLVLPIWGAVGLVIYYLYSYRMSHVGRGLVEVHEIDPDIPEMPAASPPLL